MVSQDNWGDFKFEDTQPNSFLTLRNNIKEHICRFLPERKDLYQACLIHPQWRIAAQSVLWEKVQFEKPDNLRIFLSTINSNNKAALLVKNVQLVFIDHDQETPFAPIAKSKLERHRPSTLSNLDIAANIASKCENITHLAIYGYGLGLKDIELLSAYARNLKSLVIVGAPERVPVNLNTLLHRLHQLRLDGPFGLTSPWVSALSQRASHLTSLQFSLEYIGSAILDAICASGLPLTELTLTEAIHLTDPYVRHTLQSFPRLKRFRVESCVQLTSVSIAHGVVLCPDLLDLEIRAQAAGVVSGSSSSSNSIDNSNTLNGLYDVLSNAHGSTDFARPTRLVLQNMQITDDELHALSRFFTQLQHLGISGCRQLTNACLEEFVTDEDFRFLRSLSLQQCPLIDSNLFALMSKSREICQSLMHLYFDACGDIDLHDVYQLCVHCHQDNLREVKLVHYDHLADTVLGSFSESESKRTLLLTRRYIDALAHSEDPVLTKSIPDNVMLTGKQLVRLADHLKMSVQDLDDLIAQVIKQDEQAVLSDHVASSPGVPARASHDRLMALRALSRIDHRPSTPAVWSNDEAKNGLFVDAPPKNNLLETTSLLNQPNYQDDMEEELVYQDEMEEEEDDDDSFGHDHENETSYDEDQNEDDEDVSNQSDKLHSSWNNKNGGTTSFHPEGNLGGWGALTESNWGTPSTSTSSPKTSLKEVQMEQQQQQQQQSFTSQNYWTSYKADTYENEWKQTPLEHNAAQQRKNFTAGHYRNAPQVMESDGWGQVKTNIPWNDPQQGYERSVIEEQQKTDFWNQSEHGQWVLASGPSASKNNNSYATAAPSISNQRRTPKQNQARNKSRKVDSSSSDEDQYNYTTATATAATAVRGVGTDAATSQQRNSFCGVVSVKTRPRSNSVVSSDESVNWEQDDNRVQIKVHTDFPPLQRPAAAAAANATKSRDQASTTHWNNATDWQARSTRNTTTAATAATTTTITTTAAAAAATTHTTRFSRRAITPRNNSSSNAINNHNNNNTTASENVWWDYAKAPDQTPATPVRKVAPPPPSPQPKTTTAASAPAVVPAPAVIATPLLIDTENGDSSKKQPVHTGEIWSNLNDLVIDSFVPPKKTTTLLKPANAANAASAAASLPVDDLFDMPETGANDGAKEFRFVERIVGTMTDAEVQREKTAMEKDNLVSLDSDSSTPEEEEDDQFESRQQQRKRKSATNLMEDSFASLDLDVGGATTTTTTTSAVTSSILSPTPSKTPVLSPLIQSSHVGQAQRILSSSPVAPPPQPQQDQLQSSPAQSYQALPQTQQFPVQPEQQQQQQQPFKTSSPADILNNKKSVGHRPINLTVPGHAPLRIEEDDHIPTKCKAYCDQEGMPEMVEKLIDLAETERTAKVTRRILRKSGKKKNASPPFQ